VRGSAPQCADGLTNLRQKSSDLRERQGRLLRGYLLDTSMSVIAASVSNNGEGASGAPTGPGCRSRLRLLETCQLNSVVEVHL
jgi:hypothetical protein